MQRFILLIALGSVALAVECQGFTATANVSAGVGTVQSADAFMAGDEVVFSYQYDSKGDWDCSLFDPPNGDAFMILSQGAMHSGKGTMIYAVLATKLIGKSEITTILDHNNQRGTVVFRLKNGISGLRKASIPLELVSQVIRSSTQQVPAAEVASSPISTNIKVPATIAPPAFVETPRSASVIGADHDGRLVGHWTGVSWANDWTFLDDGTGVYHQSGITEPFVWTTESNSTLVIPSMVANVKGAKNYPTYRFVNGHLFIQKFSGVRKVWFEDEYTPVR